MEQEDLENDMIIALERIIRNYESLMRTNGAMFELSDNFTVADLVGNKLQGPIMDAAFDAVYKYKRKCNG